MSTSVLSEDSGALVAAAQKLFSESKTGQLNSTVEGEQVHKALGPHQLVISKSTTKVQLGSFLLSSISAIGEFDGRILFEKDTFDPLLKILQETGKLPKLDEGTLKALKYGKAIYLQLLKALTPEMMNLCRRHIEYSVHSLWSQILLVINPIDLGSAVGAAQSLCSEDLFGSMEWIAAFAALEEYDQKLKEHKIDSRLIWVWHKIPTPYRKMVQDAMRAGWSYDRVKQELLTEFGLDARKGSTTMGMMVAAGAVEQEPVPVMKAAMQQQYQQQRGHKGAQLYQGNSNNQSRTDVQCFLCKGWGHMRADCPNKEIVERVLGAKKWRHQPGMGGQGYRH